MQQVGDIPVAGFRAPAIVVTKRITRVTFRLFSKEDDFHAVCFRFVVFVASYLVSGIWRPSIVVVLCKRMNKQLARRAPP